MAVIGTAVLGVDVRISPVLSVPFTRHAFALCSVWINDRLTKVRLIRGTRD